jgi:hypothetical protein
MADLEQALGQYLIYRSWLRRTNAERTLYVAINDVAYKALFLDISGRVLIEDYQIKMIVVDAASREIIEWIN